MKIGIELDICCTPLWNPLSSAPMIWSLSLSYQQINLDCVSILIVSCARNRYTSTRGSAHRISDAWRATLCPDLGTARVSRSSVRTPLSGLNLLSRVAQLNALIECAEKWDQRRLNPAVRSAASWSPRASISLLRSAIKSSSTSARRISYSCDACIRVYWTEFHLPPSGGNSSFISQGHYFKLFALLWIWSLQFFGEVSVQIGAYSFRLLVCLVHSVRCSLWFVWLSSAGWQ